MPSQDMPHLRQDHLGRLRPTHQPGEGFRTRRPVVSRPPTSDTRWQLAQPPPQSMSEQETVDMERADPGAAARIPAELRGAVCRNRFVTSLDRRLCPCWRATARSSPPVRRAGSSCHRVHAARPGFADASRRHGPQPSAGGPNTTHEGRTPMIDAHAVSPPRRRAVLSRWVPAGQAPPPGRLPASRSDYSH